MPSHPLPPAGKTQFGSAPPGDAALERVLLRKLAAQTKPQGSLGLLENVALRLGLLQKTEFPKAETLRICVFAGSHGVAKRGVSAYPPEVTAQMVKNFLSGGAAICVLARAANASLHVIDTGVTDTEENVPGVVQPPHGTNFFQRALRRGTRCFCVEPAMSAEECNAALEAGREQARLALDQNLDQKVDVLAIGEMGIGNTTSAAALCAALLPAPPRAVAGLGTGIDDAGLARKIRLIEEALETHAVNLHDETAARHWLECVGGYEIAAMTGCILEAARTGLPVLVDGFIASAAALVAARMVPNALDCCFFAHQSAEAGHALLLEKLGATPLLQLGLRLGEGTGAALAFPLLRAAARLLCEMATFEEAGVSQNVSALQEKP